MAMSAQSGAGWVLSRIKPRGKPKTPLVPDSWVGAYRSYAGWVPNVRSHLSFSMIGAAKEALTYTEPYRDRPSRVIIVHQHRMVNDYPVYKPIALRIAPDISLHWFMDAATEATDIPIIQDGIPVPQRDRQGMLRGTVRLLPYMDDKRVQKARQATFEQIDALLGIESLDPDAVGNSAKVDERIDAHRAEIMRLIGLAGPAIILQFALMRTGECRIWYDAEPGAVDIEEHSDVDLDLHADADDVARAERIAELDQLKLDKKLHWIAAQAYYFIKDVVHDHTHHDATSDQITPLYRFGRSRESHHNDEVAWRRETLWSLSREIERLNREGGLTDQRKSLGIIAHAEAFQAALMSHERKQDGTERFVATTSVHDYDFKHLKDSIKASIDVKSTQLSQLIQISIAGSTTFIGTTALISSLVSAHNSSLQVPPAGETVEKQTLGGVDAWLPWLAHDPALTGFIVTSILLGLTALYIADGPAGIYNPIQRWISQFGRAIAVTLFQNALVKQKLFTVAFNLFFAGVSTYLTYLCFRTVIDGAIK